MTRRPAAAAVAVLALLATTAASGGGAPPITISARPLIVPAPISPQFDAVTLSGSIASRQGDESITVQANDCVYPGWRDVHAARTDASGRWQTTADALTKTTFRAKWKTAISAGVTVLARPGVALEAESRVRWRVSLLAERSFLDRKARLQRFDKATRRWKTVKSVRLTEKERTGGVGVWTVGHVQARLPRGTQLRAYVPRQIVRPCYLAGYSVIMTVQ